MVTRLEVIRAGHTPADAEAAARFEAIDVVRGALGSADGADGALWSAAIGAAERLGVVDAADVEAALRCPIPEVVRRAAEAAARFTRPSIDRQDAPDGLDEALLLRLAGPDSVLAEVAAWALGERCPEDGGAPDAVARALSDAVTGHDDALVREAAVAALGCAGVAFTLPAVLAACADRATVRRRAVLALAAFDGPEVDAALESARSDRDWQVRQAAEDLLR